MVRRMVLASAVALAVGSAELVTGAAYAQYDVGPYGYAYEQPQYGRSRPYYRDADGYNSRFEYGENRRPRARRGRSREYDAASQYPLSVPAQPRGLDDYTGKVPGQRPVVVHGPAYQY